MGPGRAGTTGASMPGKALLAVGGSTTDAGLTSRATPLMVVPCMMLWVMCCAMTRASRRMKCANYCKALKWYRKQRNRFILPYADVREDEASRK